MSDLNSFLQPDSSPANDGNKNVPWKQGVVQNIQQNRIRMSQANIKNFVMTSNTSSASGGISNGVTLFLDTTLTPLAPHQNDVNFAQLYVGVYQGTAAVPAFQIYPQAGGSITPGAYTVGGDYNYTTFATATPQALSAWSGMITNNSAGAQTIYFITQWKYLQYNNGTVTQ